MIKVLIVDDSAIVRKVLTDKLSKYSDIEVVGSAVDPYVARDKILRLKPDVITLDVEMPRMDGLSFLTKLMKHYPLPVVIVSSLTPENSETAIRALELGAIDVISKPGSTFSTPDVDKRLIRVIRTAAASKVKKRTDNDDIDRQTIMQRSDLNIKTTHKIVAIGASTGGTNAVEHVLCKLPVNFPGILIVQHMPEYFTKSFAERLNARSQMEVHEARDNEPVVPGTALVAPGNKHMLLQRSGTLYYIRIKDGPPVHHQKPSVDVLFQSVAKNAGRNAVGVILTGMGADGAKGLLEMRQTGAYTLAQDEQTCVVFGMPKEAIKLKAVDKVVPLQNVSGTVIDYLSTETAAA